MNVADQNVRQRGIREKTRLLECEELPAEYGEHG